MIFVVLYNFQYFYSNLQLIKPTRSRQVLKTSLPKDESFKELEECGQIHVSASFKKGCNLISKCTKNTKLVKSTRALLVAIPGVQLLKTIQDRKGKNPNYDFVARDLFHV